MASNDDESSYYISHFNSMTPALLFRDYNIERMRTDLDNAFTMTDEQETAKQSKYKYSRHKKLPRGKHGFFVHGHSLKISTLRQRERNGELFR